jgi:pilus assembly protein CpaF
MADSIAPKFVQPLADWKREAGPLRAYLSDDTISEIMVNKWDEIFLERNGKIERAQAAFVNEAAFAQCVQSFCAFAGREVNRRAPYADARLPDGSRMNVVVAPVAFGSPAMTIRKARSGFVDYKNLIKIGSITEKAVYFLNHAVDAHQNIIVSGGGGSGKTTLLSVLSSFIDGNQRIVAIEDTAELQIQVRNFVRMEIPPAYSSETEITMAELLRNALRMRPDRILIGECRGAEALDMLMAMNTGHEGSMTTIHANRAIDALRRIESMVLHSGLDIPNSLIQQNVASTLHYVVHLERGVDGQRRVDEILEIRGWEKNNYVTAPIFKWRADTGLVTTGETPRFADPANKGPVQFPSGFFQPNASFSIPIDWRPRGAA